MSSSPKKQQRKLPPRPKIKLPVPGQFPGHYPQTPMGFVTTPYGQTPVPLTPVSGQPTIIYTNRASEFFGHFKGFRDWTKSGLSVGEKSAFWLYEKVSSWSKRWFTHIFLFFVLFLYSVLGAFLFLYIEGKYETSIQEDIKKERDEMIQQIRDLWNNQELVDDSEKWKGRAKNHLMDYEEKLYQFLKKLNFQATPTNANWAFWNAVIYCSTIYTTIVTGEESAGTMDEEEERRARMERMVEDTERMEMLVVADEEKRPARPSPRRQLEAEDKPKARAASPAVARSEARDEEEARAKPEAKPVDEPEPPPPHKTARRPRETGESSELRRRMGSPEASRSRQLSPEASRSRQRSPDASRSRQLSPSQDLKRSNSGRHRQEVEEVAPRRSPRLPRKQIIPLSDESLIQDVARAKRAYAHREPSDDYEYEDDDEEDEEEEEEYEYVRTRRRREAGVRRRKTSVMHSELEKEEIRKSVGQTSSWFSWIPFFGRRNRVDEMIDQEEKQAKEKKKEKEKLEEEERRTSIAAASSSDKASFLEFLKAVRDFGSEFREFCRQNPEQVQILVELRNICVAETVITLVVCGLGGLAFRFTEGAFESFYKCGVKRVKRDFLDSLWGYSHNMKEDDWKSMARRKLMEFEEQLHAAHEAGVQTYSGQKSWTFLNAVVYCLTVVTTIGYGHISPSTTTGRALTIVYAIFGIPMFLIVLADFGKLFTRGIKFLWAFVRRLYYTGSCRKVRRTVPMQEMMKGVQMVYDFATFRRPSQMTPEELVEMQRQQQTVLGMDGSQPQPESPSTPALSSFEIDDEFNLPISVAITILVLYIFVGATVFNIAEEWSFFESFYFVFISMSTIGFGDFVPKDPLYMMLSIVYLIFGLALTSMCINVVQVMLTDQFKQASQKIGQSIGFQVSEEDGSLKPAPPEAVEVAEVHGAAGTSDVKEAPKAKQEDVEL